MGVMTSKVGDVSSTYNNNTVHKKNVDDHKELSFSNILKGQLNELNSLQIEADKSTQQLITGEAQNAYEVMIKTQEAVLAFEMTIQLRNKIVEAYQEVMRMQV